jgi:hypothetical protein
MSHESFTKLVSILQPALEQNNNRSINSCGELAISAPHIPGLTMQWCSGSSFNDIHDAGNFLVQHFFDYFGRKFLHLLSAKDFR